MLNRRVRPEAWKAYFDALSKRLRKGEKRTFGALHAVVPEMTGTRAVVHGRPLLGITYDPREQVLYLAFDVLTHRVARPETIWAAAGRDGEINDYLIVCRDGSRHALELRSHPSPYEVNPPARAGGFGHAVRSWWQRRVRRERPERPQRPHGGEAKPYVWPSPEQVPEAGAVARVAPGLEEADARPAPGPLQGTCRRVRETFRAATPG